MLGCWDIAGVEAATFPTGMKAERHNAMTFSGLVGRDTAQRGQQHRKSDRELSNRPWRRSRSSAVHPFVNIGHDTPHRCTPYARLGARRTNASHERSPPFARTVPDTPNAATPQRHDLFRPCWPKRGPRRSTTSPNGDREHVSEGFSADTLGIHRGQPCETHPIEWPTPKPAHSATILRL